MRQVTWLFMICGLGCLLAACGTDPAATLTPTPAPQLRVILSETFKNQDNHWDIIPTPDLGEANYGNSENFFIKVSKTNTFIWSTPDLPQAQSLRDVEITVEAKKKADGSNNLFGVICRHKDDRNFYFFVIGSDGYFGIGKVIDGKYQLINRTDYPPTRAVSENDQPNRIEATCFGKELSLSINGELVDRQIDASLDSGGVGLIAGTLGGQTVIEFKNFIVRGP